MQKRLIYNYLSDDELLRISNKIKESEKSTAGEICVSIKEKKTFLTSSVYDLAKKEFYKLGVYKTRDKTGILIFILLEKKQFYILADEGINEIVPENTWDGIKDEMQRMFIKGNFCKGIIYGIDEIGSLLSKHFPIKPDDTNELSNKVALG
ncbi:MAG: TPM domain-containing protein [Bacteroidetes bacterium]|nr:TPM domain-containing protein [Bacteroidota bacterium]MCH8940918.1 TPM domain-containing protein [Bacteroidota bacterium]